VRHRIRQSQMRQLHGALRLRGLRSQRHVRIAARFRGHREGHPVHPLPRWGGDGPVQQGGQTGSRIRWIDSNGEHRAMSEPVNPVSELRVNPDLLEVAPGSVHEDLQGWVPDLASPDETRIALEKAFHYRGDITITLKDGATVTGFVFDRRAAPTLAESVVR